MLPVTEVVPVDFFGGMREVVDPGQGVEPDGPSEIKFCPTGEKAIPATGLYASRFERVDGCDALDAGEGRNLFGEDAGDFLAEHKGGQLSVEVVLAGHPLIHEGVFLVVDGEF